MKDWSEPGLKKKNREAAERRFVRETASRKQEQRSDHAATAGLLKWIAGTANASRFVRVELTFKLRVQTPLGKRIAQPTHEPEVHHHEGKTGSLTTSKIAAIDDSRVMNVRVKKPQPLSLKTAPLFVPAHYLPEDEPAKAAVRIISALNKRFFKGRTRRTTSPEKLTVLVCLHDRNAAGRKCRPHFHVLVALPATVSNAAFMTALRHAMKRERFINRRLLVEAVEDLAGSVFYNANPYKHSGRAPVVMVHPHPLTDTKEPSQ